MANKDGALRFAVGSADGPRSDVWRVWAGTDGSVYIAQRSLAGQFKVSLHPSGDWRVAFTRLEDAQRLANLPKGERVFHRLTPAPGHPGTRRGFTILIPWFSAFVRQQPELGPICWLPVPDGYAAEVQIILIDRNVPIDWSTTEQQDTLMARLTLETGGAIAVACFIRPVLKHELIGWATLQERVTQTENVKTFMAGGTDLTVIFGGEIPPDNSGWFVELPLGWSLADQERKLV